MRRLLLVTAGFAPCQWIGARRPERMARWLPELGWQVTVLTLRPFYTPPVDAALRATGNFETLRTHAWMPRQAARNLRDRGSKGAPASGSGKRQATSWLARAKLRANSALQSMEFPDEFVGWRPFAQAAVARRQFDVVLATLPPVSCGPLAVRLARQTGAKLALDYRDSWAEVCGMGADAALQDRHRREEDAVLAAAGLLIGVTPTVADRLRARSTAPVAFIPNAVDDDSPKAPLPAQPSLTYAGSLAYGRDLAPIFSAMAELRAQSGLALRLSYAGPHSALCRQQAAERGVADLIDDHGQLPVQGALRLVDAASAAVVISSPGYEYAYPGKIFEILGRQRPILALGPPQSEVVRLPRQFALGWSHTPDDRAGLLATLRAIASGAPADLSGIAQFSPAATMRDLARALDALAGGEPAQPHR